MIRVTIRGSKEFFEVARVIPNRMRLAIFRAVRDTAIIIQSEAKKNAPVFRGLLRASIMQNVRVEGDRVVGEVGSELPYADVVESGRAQGWFPNIAQLRIWADRKFGVKDASFVIGRAIKRRGFVAQPFLAPAAEAAVPRAVLIFTGRILEALAEAQGGSGGAG